MDPGSVGTSLHFDGHDLQSLQEAEYRKEEEEQQCELRQILTNAFDLMDEDILSETSEECESHDGSSYKPDASFNHDGDNHYHRDTQDQRLPNGFNNFENTSNQNGGFNQMSQPNQNYSQNHEQQHEYHYSSTQDIPKSSQDVQRNSTDIQISQPRTSHEFSQNRHAMTENVGGGHEFTSRNQDIHRKTSFDQEYAQSLGYSSLPVDVQHGNTNNNHHVPEPTANIDNHYTTNGQSYVPKYYPYSNTPESLPQSDMAINAYYTENRYTVAGRRSSLDISYPNQESLELDNRTTPSEFARNNQDFNPGYQGDLHNYKHYIGRGSQLNLTESNPNFNHIGRGSQHNLTESNPNFNNMAQQPEKYESLARSSSDLYQTRPLLVNQDPFTYANTAFPTHSYQYGVTQSDSIPHSRYSEISRQNHEYGASDNQAYLNSAPKHSDIPSRAQHFTHEEDSQPKHKSEIPAAHQESYPYDEVAQLRILNKARAKESEELSNKYETLKQDSAREMRILKHQMTLMEEEKDRMKAENHQVEESNKKLNEENHSLRSEMQRLVQELEGLSETKEDLCKKLKAAETNIENLNVQLIEAQLSDTQNRNRQQQEMMINGLQQKFDQEKQAMTEKFEKAYQIINEKEEAIESLNRELQEEKIKVSLLEKNEGLRSNGHDKTEEICRSLQMEIQGLKDQLQNSHNKSASRLGAYSKSTQVLDHVHDDSMVDLGIRKTLHFNSTPNISHIDDHSTQERIQSMQRELESIQSSNNRKQEIIDRLQRDLNNASTHIDLLRKTLASKEESDKGERELGKRLEEMVENEEKLTEINKELEKKLTKLEEQRKDLVDRLELEKTLKELDKVKEMYIAECEDRGKHEQKLKEKFEEKLKQTTEAFSNMEAELSSKIKELSETVAAKEEAIKEMNLEKLTKKYSKDKMDSSFIDNLHVGVGSNGMDTDRVVLNNKRDPTADESKDSSNLNNSGLFFKNSPESADSFEKSSNESLRSSNQSWQSGIAGKAIGDLKKQHRSEIEYVRQALIEENKKISVNLHQKMLEMREAHKQVIRKIKQDFEREKAAMLAEFDKKQQAYLKCTKPDVKMMIELGSQYLDTVSNLKSVLMQHIRVTNQRAAEKIKQEIGQERTSQMEKVYKSNDFDGTLQGLKSQVNMESEELRLDTSIQEELNRDSDDVENEPDYPHSKGGDGDRESDETKSTKNNLSSPRPRKHLCSYCDKTYLFKSHLTIHLASHTGEKPFQCGICEKSFTTAQKVQSHMWTHAEESPFKCNICGKSVNSTGSLNRHLRTHSNIKPYECDVCKKAFISFSQLHVHKRIHTGEKPYGCQHCGHCFNHSSDLIRHVRTHTGEKPYTCDTCGKSFNTTSNLKKHKRTHSGERPYICGECGKAFTISSNLKKHKEIHTRERHGYLKE